MNQHLSQNNPIEKHRIVSILCSDFNYSHNNLPTQNNTNPYFSIKRTFSADMSSPKWLQNNEFDLKKVQSSHQLQASGKESNHDSNNDNHDHNQGPAFDDIWTSIQADKRSWGSILSPTENVGSGSGPGSGQVPTPYVHPLVKRSASSLSEKSLKICTESLGSETGSDGFSCTLSESDDSDKEQGEVVEVKGYNFSNVSEVGNCKYNSYRGPTSKRSMMVPPGRLSFPPPIPSLANRADGPNLHIRSHRLDGRLVVEAVSVPSKNCFRAQRQDGRLLLTLTDTNDNHLEEDEVVDSDDEVVFMADDVEKELSTTIAREVINVQRSCPTLTMMSKLFNKSIWPRNYNTNIIKTLKEKDDEKVLLSRHPKVINTTTAAVNACEYYWRTSNCLATTAVAVLNPLAGQQNNNNVYADTLQVGKYSKGNNKELHFSAHNIKGLALAQQKVVLVKGETRRGAISIEEKGEYVVPLMLRGCKDHKRSFFLLDTYCIATS